MNPIGIAALRMCVSALTGLALLAASAVMLTAFAARAAESESPAAVSADESPLPFFMAGLIGQDRPVALPMNEAFHAALQTAARNLARRCQAPESYGWRMSPNEQGRVDSIFSNVVSQTKAQGYTVAETEIKELDPEISVLTADKAGEQWLMVWSGGEMGLLLLACPTTAMPPVYTSQPLNAPVVAAIPAQLGVVGRPSSAQIAAMPGVFMPSFTPAGTWRGDYACNGRRHGGTLELVLAAGDRLSGTFSVHAPSPRVGAPSLVRSKKASLDIEARYRVKGLYDGASRKIALVPDGWVKNDNATAQLGLMGYVDSQNDRVSLIFQNIEGCTSIEAKRVAKAAISKGADKKKKSAIRKKSSKKSVVKAKQSSAAKKSAKITAPVAPIVAPPTEPAQMVPGPTIPDNKEVPAAAALPPESAPAQAAAAPADPTPAASPDVSAPAAASPTAATVPDTKTTTP